MVAVTFLDVLIFSLTGRSRIITAKFLCVLTFSRSGRSRIVFSPIGRCKIITAILFCDLIFSLSGRNNYSIILGVLIFSIELGVQIDGPLWTEGQVLFRSRWLYVYKKKTRNLL